MTYDPFWSVRNYSMYTGSKHLVTLHCSRSPHTHTHTHVIQAFARARGRHYSPVIVTHFYDTPNIRIAMYTYHVIVLCHYIRRRRVNLL